MRGLVEAAIFAGLAAGVHLLLALSLPGETGAHGSGAGGEAVTALEAAPESFAALARAWREPPDTAAPVDAPIPPQTAQGRMPEAPADRPANAMGARVTPPRPEAPRTERELPEAGPLISPLQPARAPAPEPQPVSQPTEETGASASPAARASGFNAPAQPGGEVALPAPGPQAPSTAPPAPETRHAGTSMPEAAPAPGGATTASVTTTTPSAPPAPRAPRGDSAAAAPSTPPPAAQVDMATDAQARPQPRPVSRAARHAPQDSPTPPAAEPTSESAPQPAQQARGTGEGTAAGAQRDAQSAARADSERRSLLAGWGGAIRARVEHHKRYPSELRNRRLSGTTTVRMEVARDGQLLAAGVSASSGYGAMDRAALAAVRNAGRFPAAPAKLRDASFRFDLPVSFRP